MERAPSCRVRSALICGVLGASVMGFGVVDAQAHIQLREPRARTTRQKQGPCGQAGLARGETVAVFRPGETITLRWEETVPHPGHCRISFSAEEDAAFVDPASFTDSYTNDAVLLDEIPDPETGRLFAVQVTLPDVECERCVLQVAQIMTDKAPYGDGNDLYYQCADIALRRDASPADMGLDMGVDMPGEMDMSAGADMSASGDMGADMASFLDMASSGAESAEGDEGGCACRTAAGGSPRGVGWLWLCVPGLFLVRRRLTPETCQVM